MQKYMALREKDVVLYYPMVNLVTINDLTILLCSLKDNIAFIMKIFHTSIVKKSHSL